MDHSFLDRVDAQKGRWRDTAAEAKGIATRYYWIGRGRDALEVAYGTRGSRPNATTVREVWKQRHGRAAAPLLVVVDYPTHLPRRVVVWGPTGEDSPAVDLDYAPGSPMKAAVIVLSGSLPLTAWFVLVAMLDLPVTDPVWPFLLLSLVVPGAAVIVILLLWSFGER